MAEGLNVKRPIVPRANLDCLSSSIDWCTVTINKPAKFPFVETAVQRWQKVRSADGYPIRAYAGNGYLGEYVDGITFATRADSQMVRLSGEMAATYAHAVLLWADNCSRLDFQVTLRDNEPARNWAHLAFADVKTDPRVVAGITQWSVLDSAKGGSTLYLGRRTSSRYFRIYNKTAESEGLWPENSWRFEVEYKPERSNHWAEKVKTRQWTPDDTREVVAAAFADYGFIVPTRRIPKGWSDASPREPTTDARRLEYLRKIIRPMITKLRDAYDLDLLMDALGLYEPAEGKEEQWHPALQPSSISGQA